MTRPTWLRILALLAALSVIAAACGDDDDDAGDTGDDTATEETAGEDTAMEETAGEDTAMEETAGEDTAMEETAGEAAGEVVPGPGFDGTTIKVGIVTDQTGPISFIGDTLTNGNRAFFEKTNAEGGVAGMYPIEIVEADSQYDASLAVQAYNGIKDDVVAIAQILGTPPTNSVLEQLKVDGILGMPGSLASEWVREENLLPIGATYEIQAINGMDYYMTDGGGSTDDVVCVLGQDDDYGNAGLAGVEASAEALGFEVAETQVFPATQRDSFEPQIQALKAAGCQVVYFVGTVAATGAVVAASVGESFAPQWIGASPSWLGAFATSDAAPYLVENFWLATEGPQWGDTSVPGMAEMLEDLETYAPDQAPDAFFAFGYSQARALVAALEQAIANGDISPAGVVAAANEDITVDQGDMFGEYTYGPAADRNPPRTSTIMKVNPDIDLGLEPVAEVTSATAESYEI